jgi:hypothetical protein
VIFDFRHQTEDGKWKSSGHCKGATRDAAFELMGQKQGGMPDGRYMSRPRDGRAKDWDLFIWPPTALQPEQAPRPRRRGRIL